MHVGYIMYGLRRYKYLVVSISNLVSFEETTGSSLVSCRSCRAWLLLCVERLRSPRLSCPTLHPRPGPVLTTV
jgi:hypothetical protein